MEHPIGDLERVSIQQCINPLVASQINLICHTTQRKIERNPNSRWEPPERRELYIWILIFDNRSYIILSLIYLCYRIFIVTNFDILLETGKNAVVIWNIDIR